MATEGIKQSRAYTLLDIQRALSRLVWDDESLREEIMRNPKEVIERELQIKFPENLSIKTIDIAEENVAYFFLPHHPNEVFGFELTERQMEDVTGAGFGHFLQLSTTLPPSIPPNKTPAIEPH